MGKTPEDPYAVLTIEELKSLLDRVKRTWISNIAGGYKSLARDDASTMRTIIREMNRRRKRKPKKDHTAEDSFWNGLMIGIPSGYFIGVGVLWLAQQTLG